MSGRMKFMTATVVLAVAALLPAMGANVRSIVDPDLYVVQYDPGTGLEDYIGPMTASSSVTVDTSVDPPTMTVDATTTYYGEVVTSEPYESATVNLAVFSFTGDVTIESGVHINLNEKGAGHLGFVLASRGNLTLDGTLTANGGVGGTSTSRYTGSAGGMSGAGAWNDGGEAVAYPNEDNSEYQSGRGGRLAGSGIRTAGGGGYGGVGDSASAGGGPSYGTLDMDLLNGGSGGGGAVDQHGTAGGGGAGGAIELVALGALEVNGTVRANGARGNAANNNTKEGYSGGGSGGGILLAGATIDLSDAEIYANGGDGIGFWNTDVSWYNSGAGGGGRIAFYVGNIWSASSFETQDCDTGGNGEMDNVTTVTGLTPPGTLSNVSVTRGSFVRSDNKNTKGSSYMPSNNSAHGSIYAVYVLPPAGTVIVVR